MSSIVARIRAAIARAVDRGDSAIALSVSDADRLCALASTALHLRCVECRRPAEYIAQAYPQDAPTYLCARCYDLHEPAHASDLRREDFRRLG